MFSLSEIRADSFRACGCSPNVTERSEGYNRTHRRIAFQGRDTFCAKTVRFRDACLAALLFIIEWAKTQGIERLDYGVSLPFFRDGIFTYKKEWGMCVNEQRDQPVCALKLNALNECSLSFLRMNPFIAVDGKKLKGVVLIDYKATEAELQQIYSRYFLPHLDSLIIISYYKPSSKIVESTESPSNEKPEEGLMIPIHDICVTLQKKGFSTEIFEH